MQMKEKLKAFWEKFKKKWSSISKKLRIIIVTSLALVITIAIIMTIVLNGSNGYIVLFPNMDSSESAEVYNILKAEGVEAKINKDGEIEVPEEQWDRLVYELAEKGYPQSTPSYGTFFDNLGMTMTDFEKRQTLRFELQDRLQTTLKRLNGVKGVVVTISMPEGSNYVWKEDKEKATASVALTLDKSVKFKEENVSAIKNLVAYSTQKMEPADVKVIDANTGLELFGIDEVNPKGTSTVDEEQRLYYQNVAQTQIEHNARKILTPIYGETGVTAVASVTLDYDKITQEIKELVTNEDGLGVKQNEDVEYDVHGHIVNDQGVVGEENNTDIPSYVNNNEADLTNQDATHYARSTEWAIGYILTQKEKAQGIITDATVAVVVDNTSVVLTDTERDALVQLVKNATNIDANKISVYSKYVEDELPTIGPEAPGNTLKEFIIKILPLAIGLVLLIIILIIVIAIIISRRMKKKLKKAELEKDAAVKSLQDELNEQKRSLVEEAKKHNSQKETTTNEVRDFVNENPEISAALIRSMIKEEN